MYKRSLLIFSFLFINTLAFAQSYGEEQLDYEESGVVAYFRGGRFREGDKLPTQRLVLGVRTGYDFNANIWSAGGQFGIPIGPIQFIPSGDVFFVEGDLDWQINLDAALPLELGFGRLLGGIGAGLYGGGGLAIIYRDIAGASEDGTKVGTNLIIGIRLPLRSIHIQPFVEARWTFVDEENPFHLIAGINIPFGVERSRSLTP